MAKMKLSGLRPGDRKVVEEGIAARKAGIPKDKNPHYKRHMVEGRQSAKVLWWELGWEGAYE